MKIIGRGMLELDYCDREVVEVFDYNLGASTYEQKMMLRLICRRMYINSSDVQCLKDLVVEWRTENKRRGKLSATLACLIGRLNKIEIVPGEPGQFSSLRYN